MKTIITHFYNEEFLLPWWLTHHKKYFDFGILIDYASTDRSVEICKEICPHWQIFQSGNTYFDARDCDKEVMFYERQLQGYRIALTVTEFLVGDMLRFMDDDTQRKQHIVPGLRFTKWNPTGTLDKSRPLWEQINTGISYHDNYLAHQGRSLHNFNDIEYTTGRHYWPPTTDDVMVFHYANAIVGKEMVQRRLQIQHKISPRDKEECLGNHHYMDMNGMSFNTLYFMHQHYTAAGETDCSNFVAKMMKFM